MYSSKYDNSRPTTKYFRPISLNPWGGNRSRGLGLSRGLGVWRLLVALGVYGSRGLEIIGSIRSLEVWGLEVISSARGLWV